MQDEEVLSEWMETYGDAVLRSAYLLLCDHHLAEDITQETFFTAYEKMHQLRDRNKVRAWLVQIASNLCRQRMRRAAWKRLIFREKPDEDYAHSHGTRRYDTSGRGTAGRDTARRDTVGRGTVGRDTAGRSVNEMGTFEVGSSGRGAAGLSTHGLRSLADEVATRQTLTESIMQLPYKYREVVVLHYYQALAIEEIANLLGDNPRTVKSRLSRARKELRQLLGEEDWLNG